VLEICTDESAARIRKNVEEVYVDVLQIFQAAVRIFTKADGSKKSSRHLSVNLAFVTDAIRTEKNVSRCWGPAVAAL
jgi:hypothetical protein